VPAVVMGPPTPEARRGFSPTPPYSFLLQSAPMLKIIRKHNKWLMVGFGILLMIAWSSGPALERLGRMAGNRVVATLDGQKVRAVDHALAYQEMMALERFAPALLRAMGIRQSDSTHWLLLVHEARLAGMVGETEDGREFLGELARFTAESEMRNNIQLWIQLSQDPEQMQAFISRIEAMAPQAFGEARLNEPQMYEALSKLRGITRLVIMHNRAARFSDRHAIIEAKQLQDSAVVDYLFIPAAERAEQIPDPTPEQLQAHFEQFASTPPGGGEFGIGYLLPPRVKLEWMKIDRGVIEQSIMLDPVEVSKRYMQNRPTYTGEFAQERPRVEADMRSEAVNQAMQAAHSAVQAAVLAATRRLEQEGRFRRLPPNWEEQRPTMETIALAVVQGVARNGPSILLPQVQIRTDRWLTQTDVRSLEDFGQAFLRRGENTFPADQVVFAAREFTGAAAPLPIQAGIPQVETFLTDWAGNRYYWTILQTREESAPDSVDEIREQAVRDFKTLAAYHDLRQRAGELQAVAIEQGLRGATAAAALPGRPAQEVRRNVRVFRDRVDGNDPNLQDADVRAAIMKTAVQVDPFTPAEQLPPETTTVVVPSENPLGLAVVRVQAKTPLTIEEFRRTDQGVINAAQSRELQSEDADNPFSLNALLRRHNYSVAKVRITSPEELRKTDDWDPAEG
jgi:hypothetical protein